MPEIMLQFDKDGNAEIEVDGVTDAACLQLTEKLEAALGIVDPERTEKPEMLVPMQDREEFETW